MRPEGQWDEFRQSQRELIADAVIRAASQAPGVPIDVTLVASTAGMSRKTFYKYFDSLGDAVLFTQTAVLRLL
ncbi:hypothetical protein FAGKG844_1060003 [Frankia sp. AgKG'84/4]